jgi:hypothetical protein
MGPVSLTWRRLRHRYASLPQRSVMMGKEIGGRWASGRIAWCAFTTRGEGRCVWVPKCVRTHSHGIDHPSIRFRQCPWRLPGPRRLGKAMREHVGSSGVFWAPWRPHASENCMALSFYARGAHCSEEAMGGRVSEAATTQSRGSVFGSCLFRPPRASAAHRTLRELVCVGRPPFALGTGWVGGARHVSESVRAFGSKLLEDGRRARRSR